MARPEGVVLALGALEEAGDAVLLSQGLEPVLTPGEHLVRVPLVPDVPHELVARGVEHVMQRDGELDDAESGADVSARARAAVDERGTDVIAQRAQLVARESLEIRRQGNAIEYRHVHPG